MKSLGAHRILLTRPRLRCGPRRPEIFRKGGGIRSLRNVARRAKIRRPIWGRDPRYGDFCTPRAMAGIPTSSPDGAAGVLRRALRAARGSRGCRVRSPNPSSTPGAECCAHHTFTPGNAPSPRSASTSPRSPGRFAPGIAARPRRPTPSAETGQATGQATGKSERMTDHVETDRDARARRRPAGERARLRRPDR